jgi:hypothetical protein
VRSIWVTCIEAVSTVNLPVVPGWMEAQSGSLAVAGLATNVNAAMPSGDGVEGSAAYSKHKR